MSHVHAPIGVGVGETGVSDEPSTDDIVGRSIPKEQAMCRLVHERRELGVRATHQQEHRQPHNGSESNGAHQQCDRLDVQRNETDRIAKIRDPTHRVARLRMQPTITTNRFRVLAEG
jgi:hypothetical protein